ncbi:hypothetical protein D9758_016201 [Tetrapyrgos nigripes]|uniref:Uncharacterized protein n=1 Tax=Tetrapyrgos nigripes TaxID=182062 RepID=A0A8H5FPD9_9AGAR|nr:hypothetical protein D9758_016201 [Tetrapyrgos nigripes]
MMFSNFKFVFYALAIASYAVVAPTPVNAVQNVIIGYRKVDKLQAERYNKAKTITDDKNEHGTQIGMGAYTSPGPRQWPGGSKDWDCVIQADADALDRVPKAWIPAEFNGEKLWNDHNLIDKYIRGLDSSWDPAKTLRMSIVDGFELDQMLIPPGLLNSNKGGMGLWASCREEKEDKEKEDKEKEEKEKEDKEKKDIVVYSTWKNVKGNRK